MKIQSSDELYRLLHLYVYYVMGKRSQRYGLSLSSLSVAEMRFFLSYRTFGKDQPNRRTLWLILPHLSRRDDRRRVITAVYGSFCLACSNICTVMAKHQQVHVNATYVYHETVAATFSAITGRVGTFYLCRFLFFGDN
jgi:hypothetical protein